MHSLSLSTVCFQAAAYARRDCGQILLILTKTHGNINTTGSYCRIMNKINQHLKLTCIAT